MINHYDIAYGLGVGISAPFWLIKPSARQKVLRAFAHRMGDVPTRDVSKPGIMIHAVSLGEINATRTLIDLLRKRRPGLEFIVSVTTETGFARGQELYGSVPDVTLVRYPLDFSGAVNRLLDRLKPAVVVLLELEVWPNFISQCEKRHIPVLLINGRVTPGSYRRYKLAQPIVGKMFARLHHVAVQDANYSKLFVELGVPSEKVSVTGTMKFDNAPPGDRVEGQDELAGAVALSPGRELIWVCGSTGTGEEELILPLYRQLLGRFPELRLVIVPRKPERFDEVADLITKAGFPLIRRSQPGITTEAALPVVLGDTIGELRKFYAMADVVFVGRSLVDLGHRQHGSDMIEPAALGKPSVVGRYTANFADAMARFLEADAIKVVEDASELGRITARFLSDPSSGQAMGTRARQVVHDQQGATERHVAIILKALESTLEKRSDS